MGQYILRAKLKNENEWIKGKAIYVHPSKRKFMIPNGVEEIHASLARSINNIETRFPEVDPDTICRYTGLKAREIDFKNGIVDADVWEHDLLEVIYNGQTGVAEVQRYMGEFIAVSDIFDGYMLLVNLIAFKYGEAKITAKKIGNIFDNPELYRKGGMSNG